MRNHWGKSLATFDGQIINDVGILFKKHTMNSLAGVFYNVKTDRHLSRQKVRQKISVIKTNTFDDIKKIVYFGILIHGLS